MAQKIFVSYNFSDRNVSEIVLAMLQQQQQNIRAQIVTVENDVSYNGDTAIDWELAHIMADCNAVLFVIGENPHNSPWLERELQYALSQEMAVLLTRLPDTDHPCPTVFDHVNCSKLGWEPTEIVACLNQYA